MAVPNNDVVHGTLQSVVSVILLYNCVVFLGLGGCQGYRTEEITAEEREGGFSKLTTSVLQRLQFDTSFISPSFSVSLFLRQEGSHGGKNRRDPKISSMLPQWSRLECCNTNLLKPLIGKQWLLSGYAGIRQLVL